MKIIEGVRASLDRHDATCGDQVVGVALSLGDQETLCIAEVWGLPVLGSDDIQDGQLEVLCSVNCVLVPPYDTVQDVTDRWKFDAKPLLSELDG